ncbi:MAG: cyanophycinase [Planctomycetes bacterium]|nr:cyanophycinase [Planctomycetota bacterium]
MKTLLTLAAISIVAACTLAFQKPVGDVKAPKGKLVVVGGGGTTPEIIERALELAGGKSARMLIVAQASSNPDAGDESKVFWMEKGATNVHVLDLADEALALREVEQAAFIWMPGGDQSRLYDELAKTKVAAAIKKRYLEGAVVGGTSAGAAVQSQVMLIGGEKADLKSVRSGGSETAPGLGVWPEVIVDQHFVKRQRFTRLLACVLDHPELVGVGIDEKTAVVVTGSQIEVLGESTVLVVDARSARKAATKDAELHSATDLKLHVLRRGDKLDLAQRPK